MDDPKEPPFGVEYAKSGRASCKTCKGLIKQGSLRMAVRFQSRFFDGFQDNWHHFDCFWQGKRAPNVKEHLIKGMEWVKWEDQQLIRQKIESFSGGTQQPEQDRPTLKVEPAKSSMGNCQICNEKVEKGELRVAGKAQFYHVKCFSEKLGEGRSIDDFEGFNDLDEDQKQKFNEYFPSTSDTSRTRKRSAAQTKAQQVVDTPKKKTKLDRGLESQLKKQTNLIWKTRKDLMENLSPEEAKTLVELNGGFLFNKGGSDRAYQQLADFVVFGAPKPCPECSGPIVYSDKEHTYKCYGNISEYTRCAHANRRPERAAFKITKEMKSTNEFLTNIKLQSLPERVYAFNEEMPSVKTPSTSTENKNTQQAKSNKTKGKSARSGKQTLVVKGGYTVDPECDVAEKTHVFVDPDLKKPWQATLASVDLHSGKNSFYKLQLLKHDTAQKFYLFRSWGRTGTTVGGHTTNSFGSLLEDAQYEFRRLFLEKSRNEWDDAIAGNFKKHHYGLDLVELENHQSLSDDSKIDLEKSTSKLARSIKEVVMMIFDEEMINTALREFEIDMNKMPLGKISSKNVLAAYQILTDLQSYLDSGNVISMAKLVDFTNRFYTLIPQNFGLNVPPVLNNANAIKEKRELLDNLMEIEVAYSIMKSEGEELAEGKKDVIDIHYEKLMCNMEVLDRNSDEFRIIKKYLENTHAETHDLRLDIVDVIKLERKGEADRFPANIWNKQLLWHGSRMSNFAGILSKGLRIAPPEAPVTGYMFGKGIYMADLVTKSANYCHAMDSEGFLLLCEVALGEIQEERDAKDIKKPKKGMDSVKGIDGTCPDPMQLEKIGDVLVPCGKPIESKEKDLSLLNNEYIVYDEKQVRLRYLVRTMFHSKSENLL